VGRNISLENMVLGDRRVMGGSSGVDMVNEGTMDCEEEEGKAKRLRGDDARSCIGRATRPWE
jgi:hypothetical protein